MNTSLPNALNHRYECSGSGAHIRVNSDVIFFNFSWIKCFKSINCLINNEFGNYCF